MESTPYIRLGAVNHPLVSAILAVRNEERYIEAVLRSLLLQDTSICDLEIIVVDGESSDATREIVKRIAAEDDRIRLLINHRARHPAPSIWVFIRRWVN